MTLWKYARGLGATCLVFASAACSERHIVAANEQMLVVVDDLRDLDGHPAATVHYFLATPQPLSEADGARVTSMTYVATFRCAEGTWGHREQTVVTETGSTITSREPQPSLERPTAGSLAEGVVQAVCDPAARSETATRRPLKSIRKHYFKLQD